MNNQFEAMLSISSINDIKEFANIAMRFNCDANLKSGRYVVDAKSIMGIFSLDVSKPIQIEVEIGENGIDDRTEFMSAIKQFIID